MPTRRAFRLLWLALIPVFVFPLYGQTSCNRNCPPSSNPCQRTVGRSVETNQCTYADLDGVACELDGTPGICTAGQCIASECAGDESYGFCDNPINLAEVDPDAEESVGACVEDLCVAAVPHDECVKIYMGRISCCESAGCEAASGAYCTETQRKPNGTSCDPLGVEPSGEPGLDGVCDNGACVAQTGLCAGVVCRTTSNDPCVRRYCDPDTGQCAEWPVGGFPNCVTLDGFSGVCSGGSCFRVFDPDDCGGVVCFDGNSCTDDLCVNDEVCEYRPRNTGEPCLDGEDGQCYRRDESSSCFPLLTGFCNELDPDPLQCDDGNECTTDSCATICRNRPLDDGTPCDDGLGMCRSGVCVPDLCIDRECGDPDGNPCTGVCISPYGICDDDADLPNGTACPDGQCLNGFCQPILTSECDHEPFAPDLEFPECDDGNECTYNRCDFADQCINPRKPNGTICNNGNGSCIFGGCAINGGGGGIGF